MTKERQFLLFLFLWTVLNIITACSTDLFADEAYYWMYSTNLDWGYFDHPPLVAFAIKIGSIFGKNEFGVRFTEIIVSSIILYVIYRLVKPKNVVFFSLTLFGLTMLHITGFLILPDGPFLLFSLLFLVFFNKLITQPTFQNQLFTGTFMALMFYSKYLAVLVVLFSVVSHLKILKQKYIYVSGIIALLLLTPHIYWQFINEFPSSQYHLVDRAQKSYDISSTLIYIVSNIPFHGGILSLILFFFACSNKDHDSFSKILKWNLFGTLIFFLLITLKGQRIEPNWTIGIVFPMIFLGYKKLEQLQRVNLIKASVVFSACLLGVIRIHIISPFFYSSKDRSVREFHTTKKYISKIDSLAGEKYIVFNRYQDASLANFYLNKNYIVPAVNKNTRRSQYNLWKYEALLCDKDILFIDGDSQNIIKNGSKDDIKNMPFKTLSIENCD